MSIRVWFTICLYLVYFQFCSSLFRSKKISIMNKFVLLPLHPTRFSIKQSFTVYIWKFKKMHIFLNNETTPVKKQKLSIKKKKQFLSKFKALVKPLSVYLSVSLYLYLAIAIYLQVCMCKGLFKEGNFMRLEAEGLKSFLTPGRRHAKHIC